MNKPINTADLKPAVTTGPLPSSRKIFVTPDEAPDVRVPLREIILSEGAGEPNLPVYDTSGAFSVKFARPTNDSAPPATVPVVDDPLLSQRPRASSPSLRPPTAPPRPRTASANPYDPEVSPVGGGTIAKRSNGDRKSTRLNSSHCALSRMPSSA